MAQKLTKHDDEYVHLIDQLSEIADALNGTSEALFYRAEAEDDDMLHLLASIIQNQVEALRCLSVSL